MCVDRRFVYQLTNSCRGLYNIPGSSSHTTHSFQLCHWGHFWQTGRWCLSALTSKVPCLQLWIMIYECSWATLTVSTIRNNMCNVLIKVLVLSSSAWPRGSKSLKSLIVRGEKHKAALTHTRQHCHLWPTHMISRLIVRKAPRAATFGLVAAHLPHHSNIPNLE